LNAGLPLRLCFSAVVLALVGCADCPADHCRAEAVIGQDSRALLRPALQATAANFLGNPVGGDPGAGGDLDPDVLSPDSATRYQTTRDRQIGLRLSATQDIAPQRAVWGALTAAVADSRFHLPQGLGVLGDPTDIVVRSLVLTPELGVTRRYRPNWAGPDVVLDAGIGAQIGVAQTGVTSALLDVDHRSDHQIGFVSLGAGLDSRDGVGQLRLEARLHDTGDLGVRGEWRHNLSRPHPR